MPFMRTLWVMEVGRVDVKLAGEPAPVKWPGRRRSVLEARQNNDGAPGSRGRGRQAPWPYDILTRV